MSHGHSHKDYKKVFGDVERASRGLIVLCDGQAAKAGTDVCQKTRAICLGHSMPACDTCEHSKFTLKLAVGVGAQIVCCPRWASEGDRLDRVEPRYEMVKRQQCLLDRPYEYCSFCPNKDVTSPPRVEPGWWEVEKWKER